MGLFFYYFFANYLLFICFCHIFYLMKGGGWHGFYFFPFWLFFVLCVKLLLPFFTFVKEGDVGLFFIF
jgi:hypothetical protein